MMDWLIRWLAAASEALSRVPPPDALPDDAQQELDRWDPETVERYHAEHGGEAPPDAPHIEDGGI